MPERKPNERVLNAIDNARHGDNLHPEVSPMVKGDYVILAQNIGSGEPLGSFYIIGSMDDVEQAKATVRQMRQQDRDPKGRPHRMYSLFTKDGFLVPLSRSGRRRFS